MKIKSKDVRGNHQWHKDKYTVDICHMLDGWAVVIFKNIGKDDEQILKIENELSKGKAVKMFNHYVDIVELENKYGVLFKW